MCLAMKMLTVFFLCTSLGDFRDKEMGQNYSGVLLVIVRSNKYESITRCSNILSYFKSTRGEGVFNVESFVKRGKFIELFPQMFLIYFVFTHKGSFVTQTLLPALRESPHWSSENKEIKIAELAAARLYQSLCFNGGQQIFQVKSNNW